MRLPCRARPWWARACRALVLCAAALPAAAEAGGPAAGVLRVGFSPLIAAGVAAEHRHLAATLMPLLRERLHGIDGTALVDAAAPDGALPRRVAAAAEVDLLIWGEIETVSDHLALAVHAWDAAQARTVWSYRESGAPDVLSAALDAVADGLAPLLLGQPWARLAVDPTPEDASVRLDGQPLGVGPSRLRYTAPRRAEVTVSRPGYRDAVRQVDLTPGREVRVAVELAPLDLGTVLLDSRPAGAAVYVASAFAGLTPVRLARPPVDTPVSLVLAGRADAAARIGPATPPALTVPLPPVGFDGAAAQASGRDRFYEELGWLAASLLPSLLLSGLVGDFAARDAARHAGDGPVAWQPATVGVTIGAVAAAGYSAYRLVRTIGVMVDYTRTADRPAG